MNKHFQWLDNEYSKVGSSTWEKNKFDPLKLEQSQSFFTNESLQNRLPVPKALEVFALLSGLPFEDSLCRALLNAQQAIQQILDDTMIYWVKPMNLAVEHCVFKWPHDSWEDKWIAEIQDCISKIHFPSFRLSIRGIQINPDGCVVAKGFDDNKTIFRVREFMKSSLSFLPKKQSNWAHIPLGRILEDIDEEMFMELSLWAKDSEKRVIGETNISSLKFIHEEQWYMEKRTTLLDHLLSSVSA